ncbi:MAG: DUF2809 domain-containing protein [Candidatus Zhuqueibacterota bacterium]
MKGLSRRQFGTLISILLITPIGFYSKFYRGPAAHWVNDSLGGLFYEIFWCLVLYLFFSQSKPWLIASVVFFATCGLEFLQLWRPPFLEYLRGYFIGATILGTSFIWTDFPYYAAGSVLGWLWVKKIRDHT